MRYRLHLVQPYFLHQYLVPRCCHSLMYSLNNLRNLVLLVWETYLVCVHIYMRKTALPQANAVNFVERRKGQSSARTYPPVCFCVFQLLKHSLSSDIMSRSKWNMLHFLIATIKYSPACQLSYKLIRFVRTAQQRRLQPSVRTYPNRTTQWTSLGSAAFNSVDDLNIRSEHYMKCTVKATHSEESAQKRKKTKHAFRVTFCLFYCL